MIITRHQATGDISPATATDNGQELVNVSKVGRMISTSIGATLLFKGLLMLEDKPVKSLLRLAAGGYLLYRGITGHCAISKQLKNTVAETEDLAEDAWE